LISIFGLGVLLSFCFHPMGETVFWLKLLYQLGRANLRTDHLTQAESGLIEILAQQKLPSQVLTVLLMEIYTNGGEHCLFPSGSLTVSLP
jgi:hypothetical protein